MKRISWAALSALIIPQMAFAVNPALIAKTAEEAVVLAAEGVKAEEAAKFIKLGVAARENYVLLVGPNPTAGYEGIIQRAIAANIPEPASGVPEQYKAVALLRELSRSKFPEAQAFGISHSVRERLEVYELLQKRMPTSGPRVEVPMFDIETSLSGKQRVSGLPTHAMTAKEEEEALAILKELNQYSNSPLANGNSVGFNPVEMLKELRKSPLVTKNFKAEYFNIYANHEVGDYEKWLNSVGGRMNYYHHWLQDVSIHGTKGAFAKVDRLEQLLNGSSKLPNAAERYQEKIAELDLTIANLQARMNSLNVKAVTDTNIKAVDQTSSKAITNQSEKAASGKEAR